MRSTRQNADPVQRTAALGQPGTVTIRLRWQDWAAVLAIVLAAGSTGATLLGQSAGVAAWVDCLRDRPSTLSVESVTACIEAGADPMARAADGRTILHLVARDGDIGTVEAVLAAGANVMARTENGDTPLHEAVRNEVNVVETLLVAGADPMARAENGDTPLYDAALLKNLAAVEVLLAAGADPTARGGSGWTPLHHAAASSDSALAEVLLAAGADVMARSRGAFQGAFSEGRTPLHNANSPAAIEVLLQAGADVAARDADGKTPLHHAAALCGSPPPGLAPRRGSCRGFLAFFRLAGSDDDLRRSMGRTIGALRALLAAGSDPNARDGLGWTPLHLAAMASTAPASSPALRFGATEGVRTLLAAGADANARNGDGETPFDLAERGSDAYWLLNDARFNEPRE